MTPAPESMPDFTASSAALRAAAPAPVPSDRPRIVVTNRLHDEVLARLRACGEVDMNPSLEPWPPRELARRLTDADAMMGFMTDRVDEATLMQAPALRIVSCALKGHDAYDVDACTRRGIWVSIVPDLLTEPTAELAIGLAISLGRHVREGDHYVRSQTYQGWRPHLYGAGLKDATVTVLGQGRVGSAIVDRLAGFACSRLLGVDPAGHHPDVEPAALDDAFAASDVVFVAAPLTGQTRHLVGTRLLALSRPGQLIVNVGRGSVVDEVAMAQALQRGQVGGYAADVFGCEDWALADRPPTIPAALLAQPGTLFTPHLGSAVRGVRLAIEHRAADNILAALAGGRPADAINQPVGMAA